ncbi:MAG: hypothetical protein ABI746_04370 [Dermatophilaceae bacterium]
MSESARVVLVSGPGGSGATTVAAAHALAAARKGERVRLACLDDDGSLADLLRVSQVEAAKAGRGPAARIPELVDLASPGSWGGVDRALAEGVEMLGGDGAAIEEIRHLASFEIVRVAQSLGHAALGVDLLVVDAGHLARAAALLDAVVRVGWAARRCLGAQPTLTRFLHPLGDQMPSTLDRAEASIEVLRSRRSRLDVVCAPTRVAARTVRRLAPGLLLSGVRPGLLVAAGARPLETAGIGTRGGALAAVPHAQCRPGGIDAAGWSPFELVCPSPWITDPTTMDLVALGEQLVAAHPENGCEDIRREGDHVVWRLRLPWLQASDVDLERRGDDVLVGSGGRTTLVPMPAAARRCALRRARLDGRHLVLDLVPMGEAWPVPTRHADRHEVPLQTPAAAPQTSAAAPQTCGDADPAEEIPAVDRVRREAELLTRALADLTGRRVPSAQAAADDGDRAGRVRRPNGEEERGQVNDDSAGLPELLSAATELLRDGLEAFSGVCGSWAAAMLQEPAARGPSAATGPPGHHVPARERYRRVHRERIVVIDDAPGPADGDGRRGSRIDGDEIDGDEIDGDGH